MPERQDVPPPGAIPPTPEGLPPEYRAAGEQARLYPMEGEEFIDLLSVAEVKPGGDISEIEQVVTEALSFREGLTYGRNGYNLDDEGVLQKLYNDFTTVEESISRPTTYYLEPALREALGGKVREVRLRQGNKGLWEKLIRRKYRHLSEGALEQKVQEEALRVQNYEAAQSRLIALENQIDARNVLDQAFIQRMGTCENPQLAADLGDKDRRYQPPVTPDKGHWKAFFSGEWGEKVNDSFWEMAKLGLPDSVIARLKLAPVPPEVRAKIKSDFYVEPFETTDEFKTWLSYLVPKGSDKTMDVIWAAWKFMLTTEIVNELGIRIKDNGEVKLVAPPFGNALMTYTAHLDAKRALELGHKVKKEKGRIKILPDRVGQVAKYISHSGLPMSIGELPDLCRSYLHQSGVELNAAELIGKRRQLFDNLLNYLPEEPGQGEPTAYKLMDDYEPILGELKTKLREIQSVLDKKARNENLSDEEKKKVSESNKIKISLWTLGLYGKLKFSDENFPWFLTEKAVTGETGGEMGTGSFGFWLLTRSRSNSIKEYITATPSTRDLGDPTFFIKVLRDMEKVWGKLEEKTEPWDNPRTWLLMGYLRFHIGGTKTTSPITNETPLKDYRTLARSEELLEKGEAADEKGVVIGDVFRHAKDCGFIRQKDENWIKKRLGISLM